MTHKSAIVGKFFLTPDGQGGFERQGKIINSIHSNQFLCQYFSAMTGLPTNQLLHFPSEMEGWRFYDCEESWRSAFEPMLRRRS